MITYYQELLNECIDLQEEQSKLHIMKNILLKMQSNIIDLKVQKIENSIQLLKSNIDNPNWK